MVYVPGCLILNHVMSSTGSSNRCIKFSLSVKISKRYKLLISPGSCGYFLNEAPIILPTASKLYSLTCSKSASIYSYSLIYTWLFSTPSKF